MGALKTEHYTLEALRQFYPSSEILFYSDDKGITNLAKKFNANVAKDINKINGKPSIFCGLRWAANTACNDTLVYLNTDIVLTDGLIGLLSIAKKRFGSRWLMSCQRLNLKYTEKTHSLLIHTEKYELLKNSTLHRKSGMDLFAFDKQLILNWKAPMLPVGYPGWDSYFISAQRAKKVSIIDATAIFTIFHQNHSQQYIVKYHDFKKIQKKLGIQNLNTLSIANYKITEKFTIKYSLIGDTLGHPILRFTIGIARLFSKFILGK